MSEGGDTEARTKTEQAIGKGKTTYFGILMILGCFSYRTAVVDRLFLISEYINGRIAAHLIQFHQVKGSYKTEINEK